MKEKIKIMSIGDKKMKPDEEKSWKGLIEEYAPDMYDTINVVGEKESMKQVIEFRPEIIILSDKIKNPLGLLKKMKEIHPQSFIFIWLSTIADEQEAIDEYMASGAHKCYTPPITLDALFHDMYVALNME